jgi:hypothetical protein
MGLSSAQANAVHKGERNGERDQRKGAEVFHVRLLKGERK